MIASSMREDSQRGVPMQAARTEGGIAISSDRSIMSRWSRVNAQTGGLLDWALDELGDCKVETRRGGGVCILTAQEVVAIFLARKERSGRRDQVASRLALKFRVAPRTVRDIWNLRTWTETTRALWSPVDVALEANNHKCRRTPPEQWAASSKASQLGHLEHQHFQSESRVAELEKRLEWERKAVAKLKTNNQELLLHVNDLKERVGDSQRKACVYADNVSALERELEKQRALAVHMCTSWRHSVRSGQRDAMLEQTLHRNGLLLSHQGTPAP